MDLVELRLGFSDFSIALLAYWSSAGELNWVLSTLRIAEILDLKDYH